MPPKKELLGKNVIFINSGGKKKKFTLERAKNLGINIILVNQKFDTHKKLVAHFIEADTYNHKEVIEKLKLFQKNNPEIKFDGAITFWEDDIPLLAKVCEEFKLTGNSYDTAIKTRNKYEMRKRLTETRLGNPLFHMVKNKNDLKKATEEIGFPAVMKPAWGADSEFVILVKNEEEARNTLDYLQKNCNEKFNPIFKYNNGTFLYEEFMDGMEVSLECFIQYGIPHVIGINEKQPMKPPYFVECGDVSPARLSAEIEPEAIKLAESALIALGVQNSLAHIEVKITSTGPKIVEVGSRMGGDDIHMYVKNIWDADMVEIGLRIACGVDANYTRTPAKGCMVCKYFIPNHSGIITNIEGIKEAQKTKNISRLLITKNVGDAILVPPEGFETAGWIVAKGRTYQEADALMNRTINKIEMNVTKFHKDSSLGKTTRQSSLSSASLVREQIIKASKIEKIRILDDAKIKKLHIGIVTNSTIPIDNESTKRIYTGENIKNILEEKGYNVSLFDVSESTLPIDKIQRANLDFVMNLCEAIYNSPLLKSHSAALFDMLQLPYTGSNPATLALTLDKIKVKKILEYHDIPTPNWDYVESMDDEISDELEYPLIVKPANADNFFGINNHSVVTNEKELKKQLRIIIEEYKRPALIEEYIEGTEFDVSLIGNEEEVEVLPLIRSTFEKMTKGRWHIYSSDLWDKKNKSVLDTIKVEKPARISKKLETLISEMALDVYNIFDCHDYGQIEFRVDKEGNPYVIELNPNPPIDKDDFIAISAKLAKYNYDELLEKIIWMAVQRYKDKPPFYHLQF
ncbi:MAG: ATP-grasp domain-containing protein [Candidatus Gracilibacteria bacterium]|jgi:D-alanine-D-alanine ligase